jgi:hypothetical protein
MTVTLYHMHMSYIYIIPMKNGHNGTVAYFLYKPKNCQNLCNKFNCTRQLHESFVIERLCKCEVELTENRVLLKTNFKVPKLILS